MQNISRKSLPMLPDWKRAQFKNAQDYAMALSTLYETIGMLQNTWGFKLRKIRINPGAKGSWKYPRDQINFGMKGLSYDWYTGYNYEYPRVRYLLDGRVFINKNGVRVIVCHEFAHVVADKVNERRIIHGRAFHEAYSLTLDQIFDIGAYERYKSKFGLK